MNDRSSIEEPRDRGVSFALEIRSLVATDEDDRQFSFPFLRHP